jgi:radical SAM protein with 4Fe4S-binding SPASM domain
MPDAMTRRATAGRIARFAQRYVARYFAKDRFTPRQVPSLSIETTNICNSDCVYCPNSVMTRRKMSIDMEMFKKIVDDFATSGGTDIDFNVVIGDPLLDKKLIERGRYVRRYPQFQTLGFVSTLQWLHKHDLDALIDTFTWIAVSITLSGRESYKKFFGVDKYDAALGNLRKLVGAIRAKNANFAVAIGIVPTDESKETILGHPDFIEINNLMGGTLERQVRDRSPFVGDWQGAVQLPAYLRKRPLYPRAFRPCMMLYNKLMIYSNGKVAPCTCHDFNADSDLILGHAGETGIMEFWNSDKLRALRRDWRWKNRVPQICKSCRHYQY